MTFECNDQFCNGQVGFVAWPSPATGTPNQTVLPSAPGELGRFAFGLWPFSDTFATMTMPDGDAKRSGTEAAANAINQDAQYHKAHTSEELTERNVDTVIRLEREVRDRRSSGDRVVDGITAFCGSMPFVWVHVVWFSAWVALDFLRHGGSFDPYPYQLLTLIVSLEAIILSTFILISQNRDARLNDRRNHLALQIALLSEQESTKVLKMLDRIAHKLDAADESDPTIEVLEESTRPEQLVAQIDKALDAERERQHHEHHMHLPHHHKPPVEDQKPKSETEEV
jgi:uncharacterized membrane protein